MDFSPSSGVVTSFSPFSMSVSVSFGPGGVITHFEEPGLAAPQGAETYLSQTLVLGLFLAILATQVAVNAVQAVRTRRRARVEGARAVQTAREQNGIPAPAPAPAPTPTTTATEVQDEVEGNDASPARDVSSDGATR
jgi:hypothetical protein